MLAMHSAETDEHGTPPEFVTIARTVFGGRIGLDPSSSPRWNENIGAERIITAADDFRKVPWFPGAPKPRELRTKPLRCPGPGETVLVNPPGDKRGLLVRDAWCFLTDYFRLGWISAAVWIGFSVEQLSRLQRVGARSHPLQHPTCVPRQRHDYVDYETGELQEDAPHASFITLLSRSRSQIALFEALASELGAVLNTAHLTPPKAETRKWTESSSSAPATVEPPALATEPRAVSLTSISDESLAQNLDRRLRASKVNSLYLREIGPKDVIYGHAWVDRGTHAVEAKATSMSFAQTVQDLFANVDTITATED